MKYRFTLFFIFLFNIVFSPVYSVTYTALGGAWNVGSSWVGGAVPPSIDNVIIPSGVTITNSVSLNISGNITISTGGTFISTGTLVLTGSAAVDNQGTATIASLDATSASATWTNNTNSYTKYIGTTTPMNSNGQLICTAAGNTFEYSNTLTMADANYYHLKISGGTSKFPNLPITNNLFLIAGNLSILGTSTLLTMDNNVDQVVTVVGNIIGDGNFSLNHNSNANLFVGGDYLNFGYLDLNNGAVVNYYASIPQKIKGAYYYGDVILTGGIKTLVEDPISDAATTITGNLINNASSLYFDTNNHTELYIEGIYSGIGSVDLTGADAYQIFFDGPILQCPIFVTNGNGSEVYYRSSAVQTVCGGNYDNLFVSPAGNNKILIGNITVAGTLGINAILSINGFNIWSGASGNINSGGFGGGNKIAFSPTGNNKLYIQGNTLARFNNLTFPIGFGGSDYQPVIINTVTGTASAGSYIGIRPVSSTLGTNSVSRMYDVTTSGLSGVSLFDATFSFAYPGDVNGSPTRLNRSLGGIVGSVSGSGVTLSGLAGQSTIGGFTLQAPNAQIDGLYYVQGILPITGLYRSVASGNWSVTGIWEVSTNGGGTFVPATNYPGQLFAGEAVSISGTNTVTISNTIPNILGSVTIGGGASITSNLGTVVTFGGTLVNYGSMNMSGDLYFQNGLINNATLFGSIYLGPNTYLITNDQSFSGTSSSVQITAHFVSVVGITFKYQGNFNFTMDGGLNGTDANSTYINEAHTIVEFAGMPMSTGNLVSSLSGTGFSYQSTLPQQIKPIQYYNLDLELSGLKSLTGDVPILNNLTLNGPLDFGGTPAKTLIVNGNLQFNSAPITMTAPGVAHQLIFFGWAFGQIGSGIFAGSGSGRVTYSGTSAQNIIGGTYNNLSITGYYSGYTKPLLDNILVNNLEMGGSVIQLGAFNLSTSGILGGTFGGGNMIAMNGSVTGGSLYYLTNNATSDFIRTYPVGTNTDYTPMVISSLSPNTPGTQWLGIGIILTTGGTNQVNRSFNVSNAGSGVITNLNASFGFVAADLSGTATYVLFDNPTVHLLAGGSVAANNFATSGTFGYSLNGSFQSLTPTVGLYRSTNSGNWNNSIWEVSTNAGLSFQSTVLYPGQVGLGDVVSISGTHTVNTNGAAILPLGSLTVSGIYNHDLGSLIISGNTLINSGAQLNVTGSGNYIQFQGSVLANSVLGVNSTNTVEFQNGLINNISNNLFGNTWFTGNNQTLAGSGLTNFTSGNVSIVGAINLTQTASSTFYGKLNGTSPLSTLELAAGKGATSNTNISPMQIGNMVVSASGATFQYNSGGFIKPTTYSILSILNIPTTLLGSTKVLSGLAVNSTTLFFPQTVTSLVVSGNIAMTSAAIDMSPGNVGHVLSIGGNFGSGIFNAGKGTVEYYSSSPQTINSAGYYNLIVSGNSVKTSPTNGFSVSSTLGLNGGVIDLANVLTLNQGASISAGTTLGVNNMIRCPNTTAIGFCLVRTGNSVSDFNGFTFPIGNPTGYSPVTIDSLAANTISGGSVMLVNPFSFTTTSNNYVNRGFLVTTVGIAGVTDFQPVFSYSPNDVVTGSPYQVALQYPTTISSALTSSFVNTTNKTFGINGTGNTTINGYWVAQSLSPQSIVGFTAIPPQPITASTYVISGVSATSGLVVSFTSSNSAIASISGNTITILSGGVVTITAFQLGNAIYGAATPVSQVLAVVPDKPLGNRGIYFDGVNSKVVNPPRSLLDFTIEFWLKTKQTGLTVGSWFSGYPILDADIAGQTNDYGVALANGKVVFGVGSNVGDNSIASTSNVNDGAWHHIAAFRSSSTSILGIYVDGVLNISIPTTIVGTLNGNPLTFGASTGGSALHFNGQLDEVKVFNSVRSASEIGYDMSSISPADPNLISYWNFETSTGINAQDVTGGNNGTLSNSPLWSLRVTNNTDLPAQGSLRWAINDANTDTDTDYIDFSMSSGIQTINPSTTYTLSQPLFVDGFTQLNTTLGENSGPNTNPFGQAMNTKLNVVINGSIAGGNTGFLTTSSNSILKGLVINGYAGYAIEWQNSTSNTNISGCFLGTSRDGTLAVPNGYSLKSGTGGSSSSNLIGGYSDSDRNLLGPGRFDLNNFQSSTITGNYVGTDPAGTNYLGDTYLTLIFSSNNVLSSNLFSSGVVTLAANSTKITNNIFGTRVDGTGYVSNNQNGVEIGAVAGGGQASQNAFVANNLIANKNLGVVVNQNSINNTISGNTIYNNTTAGIALALGSPAGNNNKLAPTILFATSTLIVGTCTTGDVVEVFDDTPQFGSTNQGRTYLGKAVTIGNTWSFSGTFTGGNRITATATDNTNGTSTFSNAVTVYDPAPGLFRSKVATGNWGTSSTWEVSTNGGLNFTPTSYYPGQFFNTDMVSITGGNNITLDVNPQPINGLTVSGVLSVTGTLNLSGDSQILSTGTLTGVAQSQYFFINPLVNFGNIILPSTNLTFENGFVNNSVFPYPNFNLSNSQIIFKTNNQTISGTSQAQMYCNITVVGNISVEYNIPSGISTTLNLLDGTTPNSEFRIMSGVSVFYGGVQEPMQTGILNVTAPNTQFSHNNYYDQYISTDLPYGGYITIAASGNKYFKGNLICRDFDIYQPFPSSPLSLNFDNSSFSVFSITGNFNSNSGTINMSGGGLPHQIFISGSTSNVFPTTLLSGFGKVTYNSTNGAGVFPWNYYDLEVNSVSNKPLFGNISATNLSITGGATLDTKQYQITGNSSGNLQMDAGTTLIIGDPTVTTANPNFPTGFTRNNIKIDPSNTVIYQSANCQTISGVPIYANLVTQNVNSSVNIGTALVSPTTVLGDFWHQSGSFSYGNAGSFTVFGNTTIGGISAPSTQFSQNGCLTNNTPINILLNNVFLIGSTTGTATIAINGSITNNVTILGNLSGDGASVLALNNQNHNLHLVGSSNQVASLSMLTSAIYYDRIGDQQMINGDYKNLAISGGGVKSPTGDISVINSLSLGGANLDVGSNGILLNLNTIIVSIPGFAFSPSNMIIATVNGVSKDFNSGSLNFLPLGIGTSYMPVNFSATSASATPSINIKLLPSNSTATDYVSYGVSLTGNGFISTDFGIDIGFNPADLTGDPHKVYRNHNLPLAEGFVDVAGSRFGITSSGSNFLNGLYVAENNQPRLYLPQNKFCAGDIAVLTLGGVGTFAGGNVFDVYIKGISATSGNIISYPVASLPASNVQPAIVFIITIPSYFDVSGNSLVFSTHSSSPIDNFSTKPTITITNLQFTSFINDGLIAYYSFDGNVNDAIGGNNGNIVGSVTQTTDRFGNPNKAYLFDGSSGYIDLGTGINPSQFTLSAWVNWGGYTGLYQQEIFSSLSPTALPGKNFEFGVANKSYANGAGAPDGSLYSHIANGSYIPFLTNQGIKPNKWQQVTLTYDGSFVKMYIDGLLAGSSSTGYQNAISNLYIGARGAINTPTSPDFSFNFNGAMDDIRIYNRPLSPQEIISVYNGNGSIRNNSISFNPLCEGNNVVLSLATVSGANYTWSGPNLFSAFTPDVTFTGATNALSGQYVGLIESNGCISPPQTTSVYVATIPAVNITPQNPSVCSNYQNIFFTATGANTYVWTGMASGVLLNTTIGSAVNTTYQPSSNSFVSVTGTSIEGCVATTFAGINYQSPLPSAAVSGLATNICTPYYFSNYSVAGALGYIIDVADSPGFTSGLLPTYTSLTVTSSALTITGFPAENTYYFRSVPFNSCGIGGSNTQAANISLGVPIVNTVTPNIGFRNDIVTYTGSNLFGTLSGTLLGNTFHFPFVNNNSNTAVATVNSTAYNNDGQIVLSNQCGVGTLTGQNYTLLGSRFTAINVTPSPGLISVANSTLGFNYTIIGSSFPSNAYPYTQVNWSISNPAIATIDSLSGIATPIQNGVVTVTATSTYLPTLTGSALLTIINQNYVAINTNVGQNLCGTNVLTVNFVAGGSAANAAAYLFQISDSNGVFTNPAYHETSIPSSGTQVALPNTLTSGIKYRMRVSVTGVNSPDNGYDIVLGPTPNLSLSASNSTICGGQTTNVLLNSSASGASINYTVTGSSGTISGMADGSGSSISQQINGVGGNVTYQIQASLGTCYSAIQIASVIVNQTPTVNPVSASTLCSGSSPDITLSGNNVNTIYNTFTVPVLGTITGNVNTIANPISQILNGSGAFSYNVIPVLGACTGAGINIDVNLYPSPNLGLNIDPTFPDICVSTPGSIVIHNSEASADYRLFKNGNPIGQFIAGNGGDLLFNVPANQGLLNLGINNFTFKSRSNKGCGGVQNMVNSANLNVVTNPQLDKVLTASQNGICAGNGVTITIANSEVGVVYGLSENGNTPNNGTGTGNNLQFTIPSSMLNAGNHIFSATAKTPACGVNLNLISNTTVTVVALPSIATIADKSFCSGSTTNISLTGIPAQTSFNWKAANPTGNVFGQGAGSGNVISQLLNGIGSFDYVLTPVLGNCIGTDSRFTVNVTTPPRTDLAVSSDPVCGGDNGIIQVLNAESNVTYSAINGQFTFSGNTLVNNNVAIQLSANSLIQGDNSFSIVAIEEGCVPRALVNSAIVRVVSDIVIPNISVTSVAGVECQRLNLTLSVPDGYSAYQWRWNNKIIVDTTAQTSSYQPVIDGQYTADVFGASGCKRTTQPQSVNLDATLVRPIISSSLVSLQIILEASEATSYQWFTGKRAIVGETSRQYKPLYRANYRVKTNPTDNCGQWSDEFAVTDAGMELLSNQRFEQTDSTIIIKTKSGKSASGLKLLPNPASGNVKLLYNTKSENAKVGIRLINSIGIEVMHTIAEANEGEIEVSLDISGLPTGIYQVLLTENTELIVNNLVVE